MAKPNCKQFTKQLEEIKSLVGQFSDALKNENLTSKEASDLQNFASEIEQKIEQLELSIPSSGPFFSELFKKDNWQKFSTIVETEADHYSLEFKGAFEKLNEVFSNLAENHNLEQEDYDHFLHLLTKNKKINKFAEGLDRLDQSKFFNILNTIFLNKFNPKHASLEINHIPDQLKDYFGNHLSSGCYTVLDEVGQMAFQFAHDCTIKSKKTDRFPALSTSDLTILIDQASNLTGNDSNYGAFYIRKSDSLAQSAPFKILPILIYEEQPELYKLSSITNVEPDSFYFFNTPSKDYRNQYSATPGIINDIDTWKQSDDRIGYYSPQESDVRLFEGLKNRILILKNCLGTGSNALPGPIGEGMSGGIIIIDDPNLTAEDIPKIKKMITWKDRTGGIILMRVPDPDNPGQTKVIDLEADET